MFALISFLLVILISILIVRVGAVALELTGLSREVASFQALVLLLPNQNMWYLPL